MGKNQFFSMLWRMKHIYRWGLMRNLRQENLCEHSFDTAVIAHALCIIKNRRFNGNIDENKAAVAALFHDCSEIITGDLPTPVKYYNPEINSAYKSLEAVASKRLISYLPRDIQPEYRSVFEQDSDDIRAIIKAADKLSALIKCIEEEKMGNNEFRDAAKALRRTLEDYKMPEVDCFLSEFLPSFSLSLDEQTEGDANSIQ
mgnify:FL=1